MSSILNPDDAGNEYLARRQTAQSASTVDDFMRRMDAEEPPAESSAEPSGESDGFVPVKPGLSFRLGPPPGKAEPESSGVLDKAGSVVKDVGRGIVETPRQMLGGISDMVHNVFTAADHLADWLNENVADLRIPVPKTGVEQLDHLISEPAEALAGKKDEVPRGESVTGGFVREATRFLTGLSVATKLVGPGLARIPAGAVTDFVALDPDAKRLADLWNSAGLPENALTDYLASDPTDSEVEKRFKHALEGAGLGVLAEGVFRGARYLRSRWQASQAARQAGVETLDEMATAPRVKPEDLSTLGDVTDDSLVKVTERVSKKLAKAQKATETGVPDAVGAKAVKGAGQKGQAAVGKQTLGEAEITINFARMDGPESLKRVFKETAEAFSGSIDDARRGTITLQETARMAERLGMTPADLIARTKGQAYNAEQIKAAGVIMDSTTAKLFEVAERAATPTASTVDQYMFRHMLAVHHAVQSEFLGAIAETGRALNAVKIAQRGGTAEMARSIEDIVQATGGTATSQEMARRLMILRAAEAPEAAVAMFARKGWAATSVDAIKEFWINALLTSPTTHIVNTASNSMVVTMQAYERLAAEAVSTARGALQGQGVAPGETAAMLYGLKSGLKDSFRLGWKAIKTGESEMGQALGKMDMPLRGSRGAAHALSSQAFGLDQSGVLGRTVDFIGNTIRLFGGRPLVAEDEFFKSIGYRMELHAQAFRQAAAEGLQGQALGERIGALLADAPEHMRMAAADAALYNTFTNSTEWFGQNLMRLRSAGGSANPLVFIIPFVRTPMNIARYAFERSPVAPLVKQWRADIAAGGARADLALARMGTGTAAMLLASDLAMSGQVSGRGPKDQGEREAMMRQGWQQYSIKVGDRWYSYNRADPFGMTMGFAADFTEALSRGEIDPADVDEWTEVMAQMIAAVGQVSVSKTYLRGMSEFFEMMADPGRYAPGEVNNFIGSFVPSGVAAVERLVDPVMRETFDPSDAIINRIPGLSDRLIPKRDLWGEELKPRSGLGPVYDTFSPIYASEVRDSPIDKEVARLVADIRRIKKKSGFQGVDVNFRDWPEVYDTYVRLAGNDLKHPAWNLGAKDFLDQVVTGKHPLSDVYRLKTDGKDGGKAEFIRNTVRQYRDLAQRKIMEMPEFRDFQDWLRARQDKARAANLPPGVSLPSFGGGVELTQ